MQYAATVALGFLLVMAIVKPVLDAAEQSIIGTAGVITNVTRSG